MKYGLLLLGEHSPERLLNFAWFAEEHDFEHVWYADEKFFRDPYISLSYVLQQTSRIQVGIAVTDPYTRHPALTAMAMGTLAELADGRAVLGIGAGFSGLEAMGIQQLKPVAALREAIELIRNLWAGETFTTEGKAVSFYGAGLDFKAPANIPIYIASAGRQILRLAGEIADGIMLGDLATANAIEPALSEALRGAESAGRSLEGIPLISRANLLLYDEVAEAQEFMRAWIARGMWHNYPRWTHYPNYTPEWEERMQPFKDFLESYGRKPRNVEDFERIATYQHLVTDQMVRDAALVGTVEDVATQIAEVPSTGVTQIALYPIPLEGQTIESVLEQFANEVLPRLEES